MRHQRLRRSQAIRNFVQETRLSASDLVMPVFVREDEGPATEIQSLPGVSQHSLATLLGEVKEIHELGIPALILFGIPEKKSAEGTSAWQKEGVVQKSIRAIKSAFPSMLVIADCCLCEYTDHGHCGVLSDKGFAQEETLSALERIAVSYAEAGVDVVAPSGMIDGMVGRIRTALDREGYPETLLLSYAVKFASAFYGPFRDAAGSDAFSGSRKHHQMNPSQSREAMSEAMLDLEEGADMLMVKPAGHYLDLVQKMCEISDVPVLAYHVSGEYAMVKAAAEKGWLDEHEAFYELLLSMRRAGADRIITYYAKAFAERTQR